MKTLKQNTNPYIKEIRSIFGSRSCLHFLLCDLSDYIKAEINEQSHCQVLQILIKSGWIVILIHRKQIRYSQTIGGDVFLSSFSIECVRFMTHIKIGVFTAFDWRWILEFINVSLQQQVLRRGIYLFLFVLFVSLEFFVPLQIFKLIWRRIHCRWKAANIALYSVLLAIKQWGFFSVPHLLWHEASIHNDHHWGPITLTPNAERLAVDLSRPVLWLRSLAAGIRTPNLPLARRTL